MPMRSARSLTRAAARSDGMTLIEVLVTLVIISVGLLGVAALQLTTVRNNHDSFVRTQAATLASDMLDRMRANRSGAERYVIAINAAEDEGTPEGVDIDRWRDTLAEQLPNGVGAIGYDAVTRIVTITIQWRERAEAAEDRALEFRTSSQI